MFVCSIKGSTVKMIGIVILSVITLALLIGILPRSLTQTASMHTAATENGKMNFSGIKSDSDMLQFINQFGLEVEPTPVEIVEVQIPSQFDAVMQKYNMVQNLQGFDLQKYKNKTVTRHTYKLKNASLPNPEADPTGDADAAEPPMNLLTILVYKDKVIGGDICSNQNGGIVSGFVDYRKAS